MTTNLNDISYKVNTLIKDAQNVSMTDVNAPWYTETHVKYTTYLDGKEVLVDILPNTPVFQDNSANDLLSVYNLTSSDFHNVADTSLNIMRSGIFKSEDGLLHKFVGLKLDTSGNNNVYTKLDSLNNSVLGNSFQVNYGDGISYSYSLFHPNNTSVDLNQDYTNGNWYFDYKNGIVHLNSTAAGVSNLSNTNQPLFSFVRYAGRKGLDKFISLGKVTPNKSSSVNKQLFVNTSENVLYRFNDPSYNNTGDWVPLGKWKYKDSSDNIIYDSGNVAISMKLDVSGVDISNNLIVKGKTTLQDVSANNVKIWDLSSNNAWFNSIDVSGTCTIRGKNTLIVKGNSIFANISANDASFNNVDISGTLDVIGKTTLADLSANNTTFKNTDISGALSVTGKTTLTDLSANDTTLKNTDISGTLSVTGKTILTDLSANNTTLKNTDISGTLFVKEKTTLTDLSANRVSLIITDISDTLSVTGKTTLTDLSANNATLKNTDISGTLIVTDKTTLRDLSANDTSLKNTDISGTLSVTGKTTLADLFVNNIKLRDLSSNNAWFNNIDVSGTCVIRGKNTLIVEGNTIINGKTTIYNMDISNNLIVKKTIIKDTLDVSGVDISNNLNVGGNVTINGDLKVNQINYTTNNIETTYSNTIINDNIITLGLDASNNNTQYDTGFIFTNNKTDASNVTLYWDPDDNAFIFAKTDSSGVTINNNTLSVNRGELSDL
jgi:hypothetical protein